MTVAELVALLLQQKGHHQVVIEATNDYASIHTVNYDSRVGVKIISNDSIVIQ